MYDATVLDPEKVKYADVVLMDVPCSGLGAMGKKRDIKYHATPESLQSITELQRQIVAAGWQYVKPHGVLLYSTCTIHRGENQEMAVWITENFPFVLEEERQLLPGTDETDGFYYARLRRKACEIRSKRTKNGYEKRYQIPESGRIEDRDGEHGREGFPGKADV